MPPIRILYVDDSSLDRDLVRHALEVEHGGFQMVEAASRADFEARLAEGSYDVVLSDFNILGFEGLQVLDAVRAKNAKLPVVIVTGTGSEEIAVEAMKRGAADYVIKTPKHIQRLPKSIQAVLEKRRLEEEREQAKEKIHLQLQRLGALREIDLAITSIVDLTLTLNILVNQVVIQLRVDAAAVLLLNRHTYTLEYAAGHGFRTPAIRRTYLRLDEGSAGQAAYGGSIVYVPDLTAPGVTFARSALLRDEGFVAHYVAPLTIKGQIRGVLEIFHRQPLHSDPEWLDFLESLAAQAAVAIDNASLFDEANRSRERQQALSRQLAQTQETERRNLSRELHDDAGQKLTALSLSLNMIRSQLPADSPASLHTLLNDSQKLIEEVVDRVRDVMGGLRPPVLDDYGLLAAFRWYGEQFSRRTGIEVKVAGDELTPRLPPDVETALFRIGQEALTNVAKHAQARRVMITMELADRKARLVIADDGAGFEVAMLNRHTGRYHWGLAIMRERAEAAGGRMTIDSTPGKGTQIVIEVAG